MAQKAFKGDIAYDWELWIGRTANQTTTWTQIFGFESLPFPEQVPEDIDVTHMQSPGRTRETVPGLMPVADWSQEKQLWANDAGDKLLDELAKLTAAGTKEDVLLEFNLDPAGGTIRRTYRGYINQFTPTGNVGDKAMANLSVKIMERQATNDRNVSNVAPANTALPVISGTAKKGETLNVSNGTWTGTPPPSFGYVWKANTIVISGATSSAYTVQTSDVGKVITADVTAFNAAGNDTATSLPTAVVIS